MLPTSIAIILATALLTLGAALALFWFARAGFFSKLDEQSRVIFDEDDWRVVRPWESPHERRERERRHGAPLTPRAGEWGGAR